jgi:hypothetical protein
LDWTLVSLRLYPLFPHLYTINSLYPTAGLHFLKVFLFWIGKYSIIMKVSSHTPRGGRRRRLVVGWLVSCLLSMPPTSCTTDAFVPKTTTTGSTRLLPFFNLPAPPPPVLKSSTSLLVVASGGTAPPASSSSSSSIRTKKTYSIQTVPTKPIPGMKPGTSGLRKKVQVWQGLIDPDVNRNYVQNFIQSLLDTAVAFSSANEVPDTYVSSSSSSSSYGCVFFFEVDADAMFCCSIYYGGGRGCFCFAVQHTPRFFFMTSHFFFAFCIFAGILLFFFVSHPKQHHIAHMIHDTHSKIKQYHSSRRWSLLQRPSHADYCARLGRQWRTQHFHSTNGHHVHTGRVGGHSCRPSNVSRWHHLDGFAQSRWSRPRFWHQVQFAIRSTGR